MNFVARLRLKWNSYTQQQRLVFSLGVSLFLLIALSLPLQNRITDMQEQLEYNRELADWLAPRIAFLKSHKATQQATSPVVTDTLLTIVDAQLRHSLLHPAITEMRQLGKAGVQLSFKAVAFDDLLAWLAAQAVNYNVEVKEFSAQKIDQTGLANIATSLQLGQHE